MIDVLQRGSESVSAGQLFVFRRGVGVEVHTEHVQRRREEVVHGGAGREQWGSHMRAGDAALLREAKQMNQVGMRQRIARSGEGDDGVIA